MGVGVSLPLQTVWFSDPPSVRVLSRVTCMFYGPISTWNSKITWNIPLNPTLSLQIEYIGQAKTVKKVKILNFKFWQKICVSDAEWLQECNGSISCSVGWINSQQSYFGIWRHHLSKCCRNKFSFVGSNIDTFIWYLASWLKMTSCLTYIPVLENSQNVGLCSRVCR